MKPAGTRKKLCPVCLARLIIVAAVFVAICRQAASRVHIPGIQKTAR